MVILWCEPKKLYGDSIEGLITSYILAIPFFGNTIVSTLVFSTLIKLALKLGFNRNNIVKI